MPRYLDHHFCPPFFFLVIAEIVEVWGLLWNWNSILAQRKGHEVTNACVLCPVSWSLQSICILLHRSTLWSCVRVQVQEVVVAQKILAIVSLRMHNVTCINVLPSSFQLFWKNVAFTYKGQNVLPQTEAPTVEVVRTTNYTSFQAVEPNYFCIPSIEQADTELPSAMTQRNRSGLVKL